MIVRGKWLVCRVFLPRSWQLAPRNTFPQPDDNIGGCQGHVLIVAIPKENYWMIGPIQRVWHANIFNNQIFQCHTNYALGLLRARKVPTHGPLPKGYTFEKTDRLQ